MRVAIIGCGWAGARHAHAFRAVGATIAWAVDLELERAASLAPERVATDYHRALEDPVLECVVVCLPHALHATAAIAAATSGKHVLVEKPIALTLEQADGMITAAERAGVKLMVGEIVRFDSTLSYAADLVSAGAIGQPALMQVTRQADLRASFLSGRRWFLDAASAGGGIMMSGGVHDFDILRMFLGEPERIHAVRVRQRFHEMEGDDTSVALVEFPGGVTATLIESFMAKTLTTASGEEEHSVRIDGDLGSLHVDTSGRRVMVFSEQSSYQVGAEPVAHEVRPAWRDPFESEARHFMSCIQDGVEPLTGGRTQRRSLELVLAAYESMASGRPVTLHQS